MSADATATSSGPSERPRSALTPAAQRFLARLPFEPDPFQVEAIAAVETGASVVVTAPTGAGKTLVAEAAVHLTLEASRRAFYTTPIKALSNQKFADFRAVYGPDGVGLLTGDNVINGKAPLVVMTTEVLRNMIYADADALDKLGIVVLDEVHYLQDRYRGSVWEEIIIHLPRSIPLVNLSATVANAREFTDWVSSRRGRTHLVVESVRPVPLSSMYLLKDRHRENRVSLVPLFDRSGREPNPQLVKLLRKGRGRIRRFVGPRRVDVVETLLAEGLLPAIYFIFSRAGCEQAAATVATAGLRLTGAGERTEIRRRAEAATAHVSSADLDVLGYSSWAAQLESGVAAHHAGMVPAFKEAVEDLFAAGLIKIVFATETLALGLNMPARAVVLERLSKFTGESHEMLQPGDYTQLTGRAGRRGIDTSGTAVVVHDGRVPIERVAGIAAEGSHPLRSSFQPSYNMAVNLMANYSREKAEELLEASFAQFRLESRRHRLEQRIAQRRHDIAEFTERASCDRGDLWAYLNAQGGLPGDHLQAMRDFVQRTRSGDILRLSDDPDDRWALMARGWGGNPRLLLMSADGDVRRVSADDLAPSVAIVGGIELPEPVRTRDRAYRAAVTQRLRDWEPTPGIGEVAFLDGSPDDPVATCPDLPDHLAWARRVERVSTEVARLERRQESGGTELVARFRAIQRLLQEWGYVRAWKLTDDGQRLRFVYNELDLLLAESIRRGAMDALVPADLAAVCSFFTFQPRAADEERGLPTAAADAAAEKILGVWQELVSAEQRFGLPETRPAETGFASVAHGWASGHDLEDLFEDEIAAGDFVRNCRQLLDLLRQLRDAYPELRPPAADAIRAVDRGIVAAGGRV